jgi:hypothetical protein
MKTLNLIINSCSECPFSYKEEYDDVGVDFGMSYYCSKKADHVGVDHIKSKYKPHEHRPMTKEENETMIRKDCPL